MSREEQPAYYKDRGCAYCPACLDCPLPVFGEARICIKDLTPLRRAAYFSDKKVRNEVIYESWKVGRDAGDLAKLFGLSEKTINTIIKKARGV